MVSVVRRGKVPLSKVEFDFTPSELSQYTVDDHSDAEDLYKLCYRLVYPDVDPDSLHRHPQAGRVLAQSAEEAGCSVRLYVMCCMLARKQLAPDSRFFASYLFAKGASRLVSDYKSLAQQRYGSFDYDSLANLTEKDRLSAARERMLDSEVLAGHWILGYKIKSGGSPVEQFFVENEIKLDAAWLCVEPSYFEYHDTHKDVTKAVRDHRFNVHRINTWLRKKRDVGAAYFELRNKSFKTAVEDVLQRHGHVPDDFEAPPLITNSVKFWSRLALAIQHKQCLISAGVL